MTKSTEKKSTAKKASAPAAASTAKKTSATPATTSKASTAKTTTKAKASGKKGGALAQAKELLNKALKKSDWKADLDTKRLKQSLPHLPTGSLMIDYLIGGKPNEHGVPPCPGLPRGKIFNLYGHEGSGKTTLALETAAETINRGGTVCYIDWENEIVPQYAKALGVPIEDEDKFLLSQPETLEEGCSVLWTMASSGIDLIVLDSVGAGVPKAFFEKNIQETADQGRLGANAAVWSAFLPKLKGRINKSGSAVLAISQLRDAVNVQGYGDQFTVQGGKAWKFYAALRMHLKAIGKDKISIYSSVTNKAEERVVGVRVKARLEKCKVSAQQGNEETFYIRWGKGIDDLRSILEIALAHNIVRKSSSYYKWVDPEGTERSAQGLEKMRDLFEKDKNLHRALEKQVKPYMAAEGPSGVGGDDDVLEDSEEDLFQNLEGEIAEVLEGITAS